MFARPKLTIYAPSRNRWHSFQETIRSQLINLRTGTEDGLPRDIGGLC